MPQKRIADNASERLLASLSPYRKCIIVMHDNPDPDAIAAGWAILVVVREKAKMPCRLVAGGAIVRAENRHMVEILEPPIEFVDELQRSDETATILVDCGIGANNQLLTRAGIVPTGVVDHHAGDELRADLSFSDIRPDVAASATIAASYLREQDLRPSKNLASALVYAVRTETVGFEFHFSEIDRTILPWLTAMSDPSLLAEIECSPLTRPYFSDLVLALQNAFVYADAALCILPRAEGVEIVGEIADLLIRCEGVDRVLCGTAFKDDVYVSVRTKRDTDDAARLLSETLNGIGGGGGHQHRAGGKVAGLAKDGSLSDALESDIRKRWLAACGIDAKRGSRLVAKREIVDHL